MHKLAILVACGAADVCCYLFLHLQLTARKLSSVPKADKCQWFLTACDSPWRWTPLYKNRFKPILVTKDWTYPYFCIFQPSLPHEDPFCAPKPLQSKWFVGARLWHPTMFRGKNGRGRRLVLMVLIGGFAPTVCCTSDLGRPNFLTQPRV